MNDNNSVDTNNVSDVSVEGSAPSENVQNVDNQEHVTQSAETKNTEEYMIPKSRFDQVNDRYKELKAKEDALKDYEALDSLLQKDPSLAEQIESVFKSYGESKNKPQPEVAKQPQDQPSDTRYETLAEELKRTRTDLSLDKYEKAYQDLSRDVPDKYRYLFDQHVAMNLKENLGGDMSQFNPDALKSAFEKTNEFLKPVIEDGVQRNEQAQQEYDANKQRAQIPVTKSAPPVAEKRLRTREDRTAFLANALKQGQF